MTRRPVRRLAADRRGATIIEFAIILPVMLMLIMGGGDLLYQEVIQAVLDGAVQKAGRDSAIQGGADRADALDNAVKAKVLEWATAATFTTTRRSYATFGNVKPETLTDTNGNGVRDAKECFEDVNGNNSWDSDPGKVGQGGANDVTLYTVTAAFPRLFPTAQLIGLSATPTVASRTLLKNQPYATQVVIPVKTICD